MTHHRAKPPRHPPCAPHPSPPSPHPDNHLSKNQIWSLHSLLEIPHAASHPQHEALVPLWALQRPPCTFLALSSALPAMAAPVVPCSSSSPRVCTCCTLCSECLSRPFPAWQTPLQPSRTWLRGWASEAVRSFHNQGTITPGVPLFPTGLASRAQRLVLSESQASVWHTVGAQYTFAE